MVKRTVSVLTALSILLAVCAVRIYYIQNFSLQMNANSQSTYTVTVYNRRGTVYDCNNNSITNSLKQRVAVLTPTAKTVAAVSGQLDGQAKQKALEALKLNKPCSAVVTADFECADSVIFDIYSNSSIISPHVIGYLNSQNKGVSGIEYAYDDLLNLGEVSVSYTVDANGKPLNGTKPVIEGNVEEESSVKLTLDMALTKRVEAIMQESIEKGCAVVLDSKSGQIRAMSSFPSFDTANPADSLNDEASPFLNRALSNYNVGSVFKICVSAAALKRGVPPSRTYKCSGCVKIGNNVFNCNGTSHGRIDMTQALAKSCNCYFIQLADDIGAECIYNMCIRMGFNRSVTLADGLTAPKGNLPSLSTLKTQPASLANFSFGQGELMLSALHIASMLAAIDNGGYYVTPSIVMGVEQNGVYSEVERRDKIEIMSETDCKVLRQMLGHVITDGTATAAKPENGVAYGKTATAESGYIVNGKKVNQSWFAGCYEGYTVVILCENGVSGGQDCAPVFKQICDYING